MMQNLKRNWIVSLKHKFDLSTQKSQKLHFNGLLLTKLYDVRAENVEWVMSDGTEDGCKTWKKTDWCFQEWHEEFGKFPQAVK